MSQNQQIANPASTQTPNQTATETTAPEQKYECKKSEFERIQSKEAKIKADIAKAQAELAAIKKEARKVDTRYKILLGAYVLKTMQEAQKRGIEKPINHILKHAHNVIPIPQDLKKWLFERKAEVTEKTTTPTQ